MRPGPPLATFDLDGTLVDSGANILAGLRATFEELGLAVPDDAELRHYIGPPVRQSFLARAGLDRDGAEEAGRVYARLSDERFRDGVTVYPGIRTALDTLTDGGALLAVATSKPEPQALALLDELGLRESFACVVGYLPTGERESKAAIIGEVLRRVPAPPLRAVMVGDRSHDIAGAEANGLASVWVGWGYGSADEAATATRTALRPDHLARSVLELLDAPTRA
ncbi:HAD hydrolase-like protein [Cnuibacter physcomitrellae]|uniref:HAD hydrolase-like protein n=1 Tax=Cnuibacter physcomitrellae TaxID=1619308 RepID=UPI0021760F6F|nr:HAD hydrolase-like protein [Cnuibacter physcomitrellae]MCS5495870.1 HAD hydrolase-like protein [Cnuibacter physcomitrellae]